VRYVFIANPVSGKGRGLRLARAVCERLTNAGHQARLLVTEAGGDATRLAASNWADAFVACGGDGTLNDVVLGLNDENAPVGVVPAGVGNVVAKEFRLPRSPGGISRMLLRMNTRAIDTGLMDNGDNGAAGRPFVFIASAGFDAEIVRRVTASRSGALRMSAYYRAAADALEATDDGLTEVRVDGEQLVDDARYVAVANLRSYGGPVRIVGSAVPDDGLLDVLALRRPLRPRFHRLLLRAFLGGFAGEPDAVLARGREIALTPRSANVPVQVDGDVAGNLPARMRVRPASLRLIVP